MQRERLTHLLGDDWTPSPDAETYPDDVYEPETCFVGDTMTAESLDRLDETIKAGFADLKVYVAHLLTHPVVQPVTGCSYCEVRDAA